MTRARKRSPFAQVAAPSLPPLTDGDLDDGVQHEARRFHDVDLGGRDLSGASFIECELVGVGAHETQFRGATFAETVIDRMNAPVLLAARSSMRDVQLRGSRLGSTDMHESRWDTVHMQGCKLGFVNLRAATLSNVIFEDCTIEELDLSGAKVERLTFVGTRIDSLVVSGTSFAATDLRGATLRRITDLAALRGTTMSSEQAADLSELFAAHLGIELL